MKIQFGSGGNILTGWVNTDLPDVDITKSLPFKDCHAEMILAEHVVEHQTGPEALRFLQECHRILKPGAAVRICCPVIGSHLLREHAIDLTLNHGHLIILDPHLLMTLLWMAGFSIPNIRITDRKEIDGHWKVIGRELDDIETCRMEATK